MLVTLIPFFDDNMKVSAYSMFAQKENHFLDPTLIGTRRFDGAAHVPGLELISNVGIYTLTLDKNIFVEANNISVFSDIDEQCKAPFEKVVLLIDNSVLPEPMYVKRLTELKDMGFKLAIRKLKVQNFEPYKDILKLVDYVMLDQKKIDISKAKVYFSKIYPNVKLIAGNIPTTEIYDNLRKGKGYSLYEGAFFRTPITEGQHEVSPLKTNYILLLNLVNSENFELTDAADVIGRDTALVISLLKMVNRMARNSEITSIRHAAAMLGQKELKKWINTAVANELCADRPNEISRLSLIRAKFAENLAPLFNLAVKSSELFLMGLFSVLDVILEKPMEEALKIMKVSKEINDALIHNKGNLAQILEFMFQYENGNWQEVSRVMIIQKIEVAQVYDAYLKTLEWYRDLLTDDEEEVEETE